MAWLNSWAIIGTVTVSKSNQIQVVKPLWIATALSVLGLNEKSRRYASLR